MTFYRDDRLALFIDGANFYACAKTLGFEIDFRKLLDEFRQRGKLVRAGYYTALVEDQGVTPIKPLVDWLDYNGFHVVTKTARSFTDSNGSRRVRGDMDVELTVDALDAAQWADHIILFTGDGDFRRLVEALQRKGAQVTVVSSLKSEPSMIADELRRQADTFIDLADLESMVARSSGGGANTNGSSGNGINRDVSFLRADAKADAS